MESRTDGMNHGENAGRACWAVGGTFCEGRIQGTFAQKIASCIDCEFYQRVRDEEGTDFCDLRCILERLRRIDANPIPVSSK